MKGLLLKDWYQVRTSMKAMYLSVAFVLVWVFSTSSAYVFPVSYAAVFLGILPVNLLAYDQCRLGGVWPDASGEQKDAGGGKVPHRSVLRCGSCCDRRTVRNGDPLRTGTAPDKDVLSLLAGSVCAILLMRRYFSAAAVPLWGRKSQHDAYPDLCRIGCPAGRRRCRDG